MLIREGVRGHGQTRQFAGTFSGMNDRKDVPHYFVYGEPSRSLDVGFLHIETVMERKSIHFGKVAPHRHHSMGQITYWFEGSGAYRIEDATWNFSAPAVSFVPSSVVHGFDVSEKSNAIVVSISDDVLKAIAHQVALSPSVPVFSGSEPENPTWKALHTVLSLMFDEYRAQGLQSEKLLTGLAGTALNYIERLAGGRSAPAVSPSIALGFALRRAIDQHFKEDWPVSRYVTELATTPHLLDKAAHDTFGMPVKALLIERRVLEAKRLLSFTIRPVEDIARDLGFKDPSYFSRFFRTRTKLSPAAWRLANSHSDENGKTKAAT
jgi:AraC family transcriptional regulator, transcriptional activator of pobA